jgi:hypothetical protein
MNLASHGVPIPARAARSITSGAAATVPSIDTGSSPPASAVCPCVSEPSGRKMSGKWVGFGRDYDLNTGPWTLELVTADTSPESIAQHDRPAENTAG